MHKILNTWYMVVIGEWHVKVPITDCFSMHIEIYMLSSYPIFGYWKRDKHPCW